MKMRPWQGKMVGGSYPYALGKNKRGGGKALFYSDPD